MSKKKASPLETLGCGCIFVFLLFIVGSFSGDDAAEESNNNTNTEQLGITEENNNINEIIPELPKCEAQKNTEVSRSCSDCNKTTIVYWNADCSTYEKDIEDSNCSNLCPPPEPEYAPPIVQQPAQIPGYSCNCAKACTQMNSCDEAYFQLNTCGCGARDGDNDGIPCESICL